MRNLLRLHRIFLIVNVFGSKIGFSTFYLYQDAKGINHLINEIIGFTFITFIHLLLLLFNSMKFFSLYKIFFDDWKFYNVIFFKVQRVNQGYFLYKKTNFKLISKKISDSNNEHKSLHSINNFN